MISVITTSNKSIGYIRIDISTGILVLNDKLDEATFFTDDFDKELTEVLKRARETYKGYLFNVSRLDACLVRDSRVLKIHF